MTDHVQTCPQFPSRKLCICYGHIGHTDYNIRTDLKQLYIYDVSPRKTKTQKMHNHRNERLGFRFAFLWLFLMYFDWVFCFFSTKEVTRSGLILPNSITLFLFLFSVLLFACCVQVDIYEGSGRPNTTVPNYV